MLGIPLDNQAMSGAPLTLVNDITAIAGRPPAPIATGTGWRPRRSAMTATSTRRTISAIAMVRE